MYLSIQIVHPTKVQYLQLQVEYIQVLRYWNHKQQKERPEALVHVYQSFPLTPHEPLPSEHAKAFLSILSYAFLNPSLSILMHYSNFGFLAPALSNVFLFPQLRYLLVLQLKDFLQYLLRHRNSFS